MRTVKVKLKMSYLDNEKFIKFSDSVYEVLSGEGFIKDDPFVSCSADVCVVELEINRNVSEEEVKKAFIGIQEHFPVFTFDSIEFSDS